MKYVLIIAGSRGLGLGLVREYFARGWHVTATARPPSADLDALRQEAGGPLTVETLDVTSVAHAAALATQLEGQAFDLLFLNAGILFGRGVALSIVLTSISRRFSPPTLSVRSASRMRWGVMSCPAG